MPSAACSPSTTRRRLSDYLIDKVRHHPGVAFFYYGDQATGRFVGAWRRDDGAIILRQTAPDVDGGRAFEWEVAPRRPPDAVRA